MSQRKNPNGLGTVYQRKTDGRWCASVTVGGHRIIRYAPTRKAAQEKLAELIGAQRSGLLAPPNKVTVADYLDHWLTVVGPDLKPKTLAGYRQDSTNYLKPSLGQLRLQRLQPSHIVAAVGVWRGLTSPGTVNHIYRTLRRALTLAVRWDLLVMNPCSRVDAPRPMYKEPTVWTIEQARSFLEAAREDRWYALWCFLAGSGARLGEGLGLQWEDVDLEAGTVIIQRGLVWLGGRTIIQSPKTRASLRTLQLPPFAIDTLRRWKGTQAEDRLKLGQGWQDERGAVFTTQRGRPPSESYLRRVFLRTADSAGVPPCRLHDLRHLTATLLVASGLDAKAVQARLGHATLSMTLGLYAHHVSSGDQRAANALQQTFGPQS
jgi:integrase